MTTLYIHTINGQPAAFDGYQLCFISTSRNAWGEACRSLRQLRREQQTSIRNRLRDGLEEDDGSYNYSYIKIRTPSR